MLYWLKRDATSYDVAMLSARDDIRHGYDQLKKDHIDRIAPLSVTVVVITMLLLAASFIGCLSASNFQAIVRLASLGGLTSPRADMSMSTQATQNPPFVGIFD